MCLPTAVHTFERERFLVHRREVLIDAVYLDVRVSKDSHAKALVGEQPLVEPPKFRVAGNNDVLGDIDGLGVSCPALWKLDRSERGRWAHVLQVHGAVEGPDRGADGTIRRDAGVDRHGNLVGLWVADHNPIDAQRGLIEPTLGNPRDGDKDAARARLGRGLVVG